MKRITACRTSRDLLLFKIDAQRILAISCDSAGAIGPKQLDAVRVDAKTLGRFTARVTLMELLSVGVSPICLTVTLSVERKPTGLEIMKGIKEELAYSGLKRSIPMLDSSEKNFTVKQSGVGVTAMGVAPRRSLRIGRCKVGDQLITIGTPLTGRQVIRGEREGLIADPRDIRMLIREPFVHELIPVGSRGIAKEANTLAYDSHRRAKLNASVEVSRSAGPSTVLLCAVRKSHARRITDLTRKPVTHVGFLT